MREQDCLSLRGQVDHLDKNGQCALVHAALRGHLEVVKFLIQCNWTMGGQQQLVFNKSHAVQQALIAAANMGYTEVRPRPSYHHLTQKELCPAYSDQS